MISITALFKGNKSGDMAKERLKLVLIHDRANTSPDLIESIKKDILEVISKYVDIDTDEFDINISSSESLEKLPVLCANIPIKEIKRKDGAKEGE